jgi:chemotaxis response regulator CheB
MDLVDCDVAHRGFLLTRVVAQDEEASDVFGMPAAVIDAGLADLVLPLPSIASMLAEPTSSQDQRSP